MIKQIQSDETFNTPFTTHKSWFLSSSDSVQTVEEGIFVSSSYNFYDSASSYDHGFPVEPQNSNGSYKRLVYGLVKNAYYVNDVAKAFGLETTDLDKVVKVLQNSLVRITIPRDHFGEKIYPDSVVIVDRSKDKNYNIYDDAYGNLYVGGTNVIDYKDVTSNLYPLPTVDFTGSPRSGYSPLKVTFTPNVTNATEYLWDFGDGTTGTSGVSFFHVYGSPGTYTVSLTATGFNGSKTTTKKFYITANEFIPLPSIGFTGTPLNAYGSLTVDFTNTTTGAVTYMWLFGDGNTSTSTNPSNTYVSPGQYDVTLQASGPGGATYLTKTSYVTVLPIPVPLPDFYTNPVTGYASVDSISFTDVSSVPNPTYPITSWSWDFGDSTTSTSQNPTHTYTSPGVYNVMLTVSNAGGSASITKSSVVTISTAPAPVAGFTEVPSSGDYPMLVTFTNTTTGVEPISYLWDFGDSGTSALKNPSHTYSSPGTYTVVLTATNPGGSDTATNTVVAYDPSLRLYYSPTTQLMKWTDSAGPVNDNVVLADFDLIVDPTPIRAIEVSSTVHPITTILNTNYYTSLKSLKINNQSLSAGISGIGVPGLEYLELVNNSALSSINISDLSSLISVICNQNGVLTTLDVSGKTTLQYLNAAQNATLTKIETTGNTSMWGIYAYLNPNLTEVKNIGENVTVLNLWNNNLDPAKLNVSLCSALWLLNVNGNPGLSALNVTNNAALDFLSAQDCILSSINLTNNVALTSLYLNGNHLTSINLSTNTKLNTVYVYQNTTMTSFVGLSGLTQLTDFSAYNVPISSWSFVNNTKLSRVSLGTITLSSVNLSNCPDIADISISLSVSMLTMPISTLNLPTVVNKLKTISANNCSLPLSEVNSILVKLDANGITGGFVSIINGTSPAPSGVGLTAKNNLIAKGWTVNTN